jgi:tripartite-type tricarboxylate transporter receptor subunit TctC
MKKIIVSALITILASFGVAYAADYPTKPVRFLAGNAAGSATDVLARMFAAEYQKALGQNFIVENKPGAGGDTAAEEVIRSNPDGYTLLFDSASIMFGNQWLYPRTFDQNKDLISIIEVSGNPVVLLAGPALKGKSLAEILAMAKAAPQPWSVGTATTFEAIAFGLFVESTGLNFRRVAYKNAQQGFAELINGDTHLVWAAILAAKPMIEAGQLIPVAVSTPDRSRALPNVPTMRESGINMELIGWNGISGPKGLPKEIVDQLNRVGNEILRQPDFQKKLLDLSADGLGGTPADMDARIQKGGEDWGRIIKKYTLK